VKEFPVSLRARMSVHSKIETLLSNSVSLSLSPPLSLSCVLLLPIVSGSLVLSEISVYLSGVAVVPDI
jgi:hypothetical protein